MPIETKNNAKIPRKELPKKSKREEEARSYGYFDNNACSGGIGQILGRDSGVEVIELFENIKSLGSDFHTKGFMIGRSFAFEFGGFESTDTVIFDHDLDAFVFGLGYEDFDPPMFFFLHDSMPNGIFDKRLNEQRWNFNEIVFDEWVDLNDKVKLIAKPEFFHFEVQVQGFDFVFEGNFF